MNYRLFTLFLLAPIAAFCKEDAADLATAFSSRPIEEQRIENLPKDRAAEIINQLDAMGYSGALLRINHQPSIDKFISKYRAMEGKASRSRQIMEESASPYIFDELAPMLYKQEQIKMRRYGEGDFDIGESATTAVLFGTLIQRAPEFGAEQKAWAASNLTNKSADPIHSARAWWELNREALSGNRFDQILVPGDQAAPQPAPAPSRAPEKPVEVAAVTHATAATSPSPVIKTIDKPQPSAPETQSFSWTWAVLGVVIAVIAIVIFRRSRKNE